MAHERLVGGDRASSDSRLPVRVGRKVDLADDEVDHGVDEVTLVAHVVVQRHGFDPELLRELAHADSLDAAVVGKRDRRAYDALSGQWGSLAHRAVDKLTPYVKLTL